MATDPATQVSAILEELSKEVADAAPGASPEELLPLVYQELRRLAGSYLQRERPGHTLQATALVHEAYERLVDQSRVNWRGRTHFFAVGASMMRRLLVDHARHRGRQKRGGNDLRVTLEGLADTPASNLDAEELLALDEALERLAALDAREAQVVELRYFGGMDTLEIANALSVSERTVRGDWAHARAWLKQELASSGTS